VLLAPDELVSACALAMERSCQVDAADKFELSIRVIA
jgi:hypothetical protein